LLKIELFHKFLIFFINFLKNKFLKKWYIFLELFSNDPTLLTDVFLPQSAHQVKERVTCHRPAEKALNHRHPPPSPVCKFALLLPVLSLKLVAPNPKYIT